MNLEEILADIRGARGNPAGGPEPGRRAPQPQPAVAHDGSAQRSGARPDPSRRYRRHIWRFSEVPGTVHQRRLGRFGSGWAWLCVDSGKLEVLSTPNQNSPIMLGYRPVLGADLWEHAYYLKYQSRRLNYIAAWWNVVNWHNVTRSSTSTAWIW